MKRLALAILVVLMLGALVACGADEPLAQPEPTPGEATGLDGAAILQAKCTTCHTLERVEAEDLDAVGWESVIEEMRAKGADLTDDEATALAEYLSLQ